MDAIAKRFKIGQPEEVIKIFEASQSDAELNRIKESFGQATSPVRLLGAVGNQDGGPDPEA